jgi:hypothetical protein
MYDMTVTTAAAHGSLRIKKKEKHDSELIHDSMGSLSCSVLDKHGSFFHLNSNSDIGPKLLPLRVSVNRFADENRR